MSRAQKRFYGVSFLLFAGFLGWGFWGVKEGAQWVVVGLFALYFLFGRPGALSALLLAVLVPATLFSAVGQLAVWAFPPVTPGGHPVMPTGQIFLGGGLGLLLGVALLVVYFKSTLREKRLEGWWLAGLGAVLFMVLLADQFLGF